MRVSEIQSLTVSDIHLCNDGFIEIYIRKAKYHPNGRTVVTNSPDLYARIKDHIDGKKPNSPLFLSQENHPLSKRSIQHICETKTREANLPEQLQHIHSLRHGFAVHSLINRRNIVTVQKQLGHNSLQTTSIYTDMALEDRKNDFRQSTPLL